MATIMELNDAFRTSMSGGRVMLTQSVASLDRGVQMRIVERVRSFDTFNGDNDPHGEHDMGMFTESGHRCMFKIDYYDAADSDYGSDDPADASKTLRVLTIMLASDY